MRLRTFTASDMPAALARVREALGDDAVILSSGPGPGGKQVSVIAAVEPPADPVPRMDSKTAQELLLDELREILSFHNLPELLAARMMQKAATLDLNALAALHKLGAERSRGSLHRLAMEKLLAAVFGFEPLIGKPAGVLMLVGTPGAGKTLAAAKIITQLSMAKERVAVATTDIKRAGGIEQLQAFTDILGLPLTVIDSPKNLSEYIEKQRSGTHVVLDTAGVNPHDNGELSEVHRYVALSGVQAALVLPAAHDAMECIDIAEIFAKMKVNRLLLTRADTARRFGGVLAAALSQRLAFCATSLSSSAVGGLQSLTPPTLAQFLLRYQLQ